jgi:hypothetical protein
MGDDRKSSARREDSGYVTIPPELREFVPAKGDATAKAAGTPQLAATVAELRELNGGEKADPFFFDTRGVAKPMERDEGDEPKGVGNAKVHVPAFALPSAKAPTAAVVSGAADDAEITVEKAPATETPGSPWATDAAVPLIARSDLPSALAPVAKTDPAPNSEKPDGVPAPPGRALRGVIAVAVIALLGFAAFQLIPREKTKDPVAEVPAPSGTASVAPAVPAPELSPTAPTATAPVNSVEIDAGLPPTSASAAVPAPVKVKPVRGPEETLYDAAAPSPAKTVEAVVVPPPPATAPVAPPKPSATTPGTAPDEEIFSRPKKKPEEGATSK